MWNIPEQRVVDYADVHEMVTATAFAPDGRRAVVGTMKGRCRFYACEANFRLEYQAQIGALPPASCLIVGYCRGCDHVAPCTCSSSLHALWISTLPTALCFAGGALQTHQVL